MPGGDGNKLQLHSCVAIIIGACIGSAIFSVSGMTIWYAGPAAAISWFAAAVIFGLYGFLVAELAGKYPRSGGIYVFPKRAIGGKVGSFWGFISGWGYIISNIIAIAFSAICVGAYLQAGFPSLDCQAAISVCSCLAALAIILPGGNRSQSIQNALVYILIASLVFFCVMAFFGGGFDSSAFSDFFSKGSKGKTGFISAIPLAILAYGGCLTVSFIVSEVSDSKRNVPLSLVIGLGIVAVIYCTVIVAITGVVPIDVLGLDGTLRFVPFFTAIEYGGLSSYPWLAAIVAFSGTVALLTTMVILLRINARAIQAMTLDGQLPDIFAGQDSKGVAMPALVTMTATCIGLCLLQRWTEHLILLGAVINVVSMAITCASSLIARRQDGKSILFPASVTLVLASCFIPDIVNGETGMWIFTLSVYATGLAVYLLFRHNMHARLSGTVVHGKGHGHLHGLPTANLQPFEGEMPPPQGVWKTRVFLEGKIYEGLTNVGLRPSDDDSDKLTVETLIMDFDRDIYGYDMTLEFVSFVRKTRQFSSLDELKIQIEQDLQS